ncbi:serine C-palmitoyltransferase [Malassezia vespertilionis]|uniref:serine C-palmitoyltransferase n=1 Tax=Malassezia vespertilionis TaxID=2020962 RepID=A0A2N1JGC3_9BASI|nr:serine C-palmitoyltransferase [Malassezia vespertilionis]PKI85593.1 Lcb1p [Malassezia vespertilionis]WFD04956.1 serine C-palmitoyltransferase [Malassezia vespertilionis]
MENQQEYDDPFSAIGSGLRGFFRSLPGHGIVMRYIASSYQKDPIRSLLELILFIFAVRTILQNRTRSGQSTSNYVQLSESEIDYLVQDFEPEPLCQPLTETEKHDLESVPMIVGHTGPHVKVTATWLSGTQPKDVINMASFNFAGLVSDPDMSKQAQKILRDYGVGSCSPPGFYGTSDMHMRLEKELARFVGKEDAIIYSQGFSTVSGVIPAFSKRGDIIVADAGVNFAIQQGLQLSRSTVYWYNHNDMDSLESLLKRVQEQQDKSDGPLRRRFIVTEGFFESDGTCCNLRKIVELKKRYRFRLFLDESYSLGALGPTGRGITEAQQVSADDVEFIIGNMAIAFGSSGGFCASSSFAVKHQRINGLSFVFSAAMPVMLATGSMLAMQKLSMHAELMTRLRENVNKVRAVLTKIESIYIPSDPDSPLIHIQVRSKTNALQDHLAPPSPNSVENMHDLSIKEQEQLLQQIVERALNSGVMLTRSRRLPNVMHASQYLHAGPSIPLAVSAAFSATDVASGADIVRGAIVSVLGDRR